MGVTNYNLKEYRRALKDFKKSLKIKPNNYNTFYNKSITHFKLKEFKKITGCPVLVNTSFNVRGEPIVCTPEDAFRCFVFTQIDVLVIGSFIIKKSELPKNISKFFSKPLLIDD